MAPKTMTIPIIAIMSGQDEYRHSYRREEGTTLGVRPLPLVAAQNVGKGGTQLRKLEAESGGLRGLRLHLLAGQEDLGHFTEEQAEGKSGHRQEGGALQRSGQRPGEIGIPCRVWRHAVHRALQRLVE